jgi:hypothetical protein
VKQTGSEAEILGVLCEALLAHFASSWLAMMAAMDQPPECNALGLRGFFDVRHRFSKSVGCKKPYPAHAKRGPK